MEQEKENKNRRKNKNRDKNNKKKKKVCTAVPFQSRFFSDCWVKKRSPGLFEGDAPALRDIAHPLGLPLRAYDHLQAALIPNLSIS